MESFVYLGSKVTKDIGTTQDVAQRIQKANGAFVQCYSVWKNSNIAIRTKLRIFRSNVKSVLLYGSETWKVAKTAISKLQVFAFLFSAMALLYMFRVTISPIIRSTYAVYGHR